MFVLVGFRTLIKILWVGQYYCPQCRQRRVHQLEQHTEWGTLFFVPIVPIRRQRILICQFCGLSRNLNKAESEQLKSG